MDDTSESVCLHGRAGDAIDAVGEKGECEIKKEGKTAVDIPVEKGHNEIVMILEGEECQSKIGKMVFTRYEK